MLSEEVKKLVKVCVDTYKKVSPDWAPPHGIIFKTAKSFGFTATIDGYSEKEYNDSWEDMFDEGVLEDETIKVVLTKNKSKVKLTFESPDLRKLVLKG